MTDDKSDNDDGPKGSFVRWQSITIGQLTYAINLILGLAVASLGFEVTLLLNSKIDFDACWHKSDFLCVVTFFSASCLSILALVASIAFGIWAVINRLRDFRATMTAARLREKGKPNSEIDPYRALYRRLGRATWRLFWFQIGAFGSGVVLAVLGIAGLVIYRLP